MSNSNNSSLSPSSSSALTYLKTKKPTDGWSVQTKSGSSSLVRLTRRNVPLTESYFIDLHRDIDSGHVVGILTRPGSNGTCQAQLLVDRHGKPTGAGVQLVTVSSWTPQARGTSSAAAATSSTNVQSSPSALSDEDNREIIFYAAGFFGALLALRVIFEATAILALVFPFLYLYLVMTCPPISSFDAKKELKRVLRGHHLPEDHPEKPKGFLGQTLARISASVATELATGLGYEIEVQNLAGGAIVACVRVPAAKKTCYWVGAAHKWWYLYMTEMRDED